MMKVSCEEFENRYTDLIGGKLDDEQKKAFEEHRRSCVHCMRLTSESLIIRRELLNLPKLEVSPYLAANVKREINRLERGLGKPAWTPGLMPRFAALASGFAIAIICSLIIFQPTGQQTGDPALMSPATQPGMTAESGTTSDNLELNEAPTLYDPTEEMFTSFDASIDTATHHLPEPPGTDSIPIPVEDDYWRINQVSTTPDDN